MIVTRRHSPVLGNGIGELLPRGALAHVGEGVPDCLGPQCHDSNSSFAVSILPCMHDQHDDRRNDSHDDEGQTTGVSAGEREASVREHGAVFTTKGFFTIVTKESQDMPL